MMDDALTGKITLNGYEQSQNLGRTLRNRYINKLKFLDYKYRYT